MSNQKIFPNMKYQTATLNVKPTFVLVWVEMSDVRVMTTSKIIIS